jgi:hypothetical protein
VKVLRVRLVRDVLGVSVTERAYCNVMNECVGSVTLVAKVAYVVYPDLTHSVATRQKTTSEREKRARPIAGAGASRQTWVSIADAA